jgi:hypothetical protein
MQQGTSSKGKRKSYAQAARKGNTNNSNQKATAQKPSGSQQRKGVAAAYSTRTVSTQPKQQTTNGANRSSRVQHRELINASIAGSQTFTVQQVIAINPGLVASFPWLSVQAANWEQYKIHKLDVVYVPIAPTNTQGDIMLSPDYDASDPVPTTEVQAGNNAGTVQDSCWENIRLRLDPSAMMALGPRRFVRQSNVAGDIKTFDVGKIFVCSNNQTGTNPVGKLWLEYDIEFFIPQNSPNTDTIPLSTSYFTRTTSQTFTTNTAAPLQLTNVVFDPLNIGSAVAGVFTPPAGSYRIEAQVSSQDSANEAFQARVDIYKNGAVLTNGPCFAYQSDAALSLSSISTTVLGVINCNGTDTFQIEVTLVGAGGTLTTQANGVQLLVSLA